MPLIKLDNDLLVFLLGGGGLLILLWLVDFNHNSVSFFGILVLPGFFSGLLAAWRPYLLGFITTVVALITYAITLYL